MNWSTLRSTLEAKNESTQAEQRSAFRDLVRRTMEDPQAIEESELDAILEACSKTRDDLWNACSIAETRAEYRRQIQEAEAAEKELASIESKWKKLHDSVQIAKKKRDAFFDENRERKLILEQQIKNAKLAKRRLIESCDDDEIKDRLTSLVDERKRRAEAKSRLERRRDDAREFLARGRSRLAEAERSGSHDAEEWRDDVARREESLREVTEQFQTADSHWRAIDRELEAIHQEMLYA